MIYSLIKKALFCLPPEMAHNGVMAGMRFLTQYPSLLQWVQKKQATAKTDALQVQCNGLSFSHPVGLAAGWDKDAKAFAFLPLLGFSFLELGTVTPLPQPGNPKPRLFRLKKDQALLNRMGFNNDGIDAAVQRLRPYKHQIPIGINIGKNKAQSLDKAVEDYKIGLRKSWAVADYITLNISSPNTAGLRDLASPAYLSDFLQEITEEKKFLTKQTGYKRPLWLKLSPDMSQEDLERVADLALRFSCDALVLSNTTVQKKTLKETKYRDAAGGISGRPLQKRSNQMLRQLYPIVKNKIPLIGVGGVFSGDDAWQKIILGAQLLQVYTGFIYRGPALLTEINQTFQKNLKQQGFRNIQEAIGSAF